MLLGEPCLLASIARIARPAASLDIRINLVAFTEAVPLELHTLPVPTLEYLCDALKPRYAEFGINIQHVEILGKQEMRQIGSDWAQRLAYGRTPTRYISLQSSTLAPSRTVGIWFVFSPLPLWERVG